MNASITLVIAGLALVLAQSANAQGTAPAAPEAPAAPPAVAPAAPAAADKEMVESGKAVFYSDRFNGRKTYSNERFNNASMVAAHRTLPMGTLVLVTHARNGKSVVLRIIDRGPSQPDRIIDVSRAAASKLGFARAGIADVTIKVVGRAGDKAKAPKATQPAAKVK